MTPILKMEKITKKFGSLIANNEVDLTCDSGMVVSLLGENGAGKSTLMKIVYGMYKPDSGDIYVKGEKVNISSPNDAINLGIQMVHQHFMLIETLTVAENVVMGKEPTKNCIYQAREAERVVQEASKAYGLHVNPTHMVSELSVGEKQRVEIIKALYHGAEILILDEPTAVLTPQETEELFKIIENLRKGGKTIIIITHKLKETMAIADVIYVLRDGKMVGKVMKKDTTPKELTELMVGHDIKPFIKEKPNLRETMLSIKNLRQKNNDGVEVLRGLSLEIKGGEIYGIAGVEGNGQRELVEVLSGISCKWNGNIEIDRKDIKGKSTRDLLNFGVSIIHSDRHERGLLMSLAAFDNFLLGYHRNKEFKNRFGFFNKTELKNTVKEQFELFDIRPFNIENQAHGFSGGNQQKIIIAREFYRSPKLVIAAQPTRGIDIGATDSIHNKLIELKNKGAAVLLISSDLDELFKLSDRIGVIYEGIISASGPSDKFTQSELGFYMGGGDRNQSIK